jgi:hypothetical protein
VHGGKLNKICRGRHLNAPEQAGKLSAAPRQQPRDDQQHRQGLQHEGAPSKPQLVHPHKSHGDRKTRSSCATSGEIRLMSASRTTDDPAEPSDGLFVGATRSASYNASLMSRDEIGFLAQLCYCEAVRAGSIWVAVGLITERGSLAKTVNVPQVSSKTQVRTWVSVLPRVTLIRVSRSMMTDSDLGRLPFSDVPHDHTWSVERKPQIGGNIRHPAVKHPCRTILEQTHCALERGRTRGHAAVRKGRREFPMCILRRGVRNGVADHN